MEGNTNVIILCPFCTNFAPPAWVINGTSYALENLPYPPYLLTYGGLLISQITKELNNTSFKCFYPTLSGGVILQQSSVGFLTVTYINYSSKW